MGLHIVFAFAAEVKTFSGLSRHNLGVGSSSTSAGIGVTDVGNVLVEKPKNELVLENAKADG